MPRQKLFLMDHKRTFQMPYERLHNKWCTALQSLESCYISVIAFKISNCLHRVKKKYDIAGFKISFEQ